MKYRIPIALGLVFLLGACVNPSGAKPPWSGASWLGALGKILPPKKPKTPAAMPVDWAGTIRMVNTAENFVLIESESASPVIPGEKYLSVQDGRETGTLLMTALKAHPFLIADIVSGQPSTGNKIYIPRPGWTQPPRIDQASPAATPAAQAPLQN